MKEIDKWVIGSILIAFICTLIIYAITLQKDVLVTGLLVTGLATVAYAVSKI